MRSANSVGAVAKKSKSEAVLSLSLTALQYSVNDSEQTKLKPCAKCHLLQNCNGHYPRYLHKNSVLPFCFFVVKKFPLDCVDFDGKK